MSECVVLFWWVTEKRGEGGGKGSLLLVELVLVMCQTAPLYNIHSHLLLDTNFGSWQKANRWAAKHVNES